MKLRTAIVSAALAVGSLVALAPQAHAGATVCYSAQVTVNGGDVVNEAACHSTP